MKVYLFSIFLVLGFSAHAHAMLEANCEQSSEGTNTKLVLHVEIDRQGVETILLGENGDLRQNPRTWIVKKELTKTSSGQLTQVRYSGGDGFGTSASLDIDMTQKLEYAVYHSELLITKPGSTEPLQRESFLCGFFYQFP